MSSQWSLHVSVPGQSSAQVAIGDGLTIGRHPSCGLVLNDSHVSGQHAEIKLEGDTPTIVDRGSNNGTLIDNAQTLREGQNSVLNHGMSIRIGRVELRVEGPVDLSATLAGEATIAGGPATDGLDEATQGAFDDPFATIPVQARPSAPVPGPTSPGPASSAQDVPTASPVPSVPVPSTSDVGPDSELADFDSNVLNTLVGESADSYGAEAKLARMRARLLILNEADLRAVDIDAVEFGIGRGSGENCTLSNQGVSNQHARIVFDPTQNGFLVEDLGSANGTQLNGAPVVPGVRRELFPDAHLRFGTIEALFLQAVDSDLRQISPAQHDNAAKLLVRGGHLNAALAKQVGKQAAEAGTSLGEALLLGQHIKPREWSRAVEDARVAATVGQLSGGASQNKVLWVLLAIIIAMAGYLVATR